MNIKKFLTLIKSINLKWTLNTFNILFFMSSMTIVALFGWVPFFVIIMPFSISYTIYSYSMNLISSLPGFAIIQMLYLKLIYQFPALETLIKSVHLSILQNRF